MRTDQLIAQLAAGLHPVERLRSPATRAALWLVSIAVLGALVIAFTANVHLFAQRLSTATMAIEWGATVLTAVTAVLAAFELAVPGRSRAWLWLPVPSLAAWLAASGAGCFAHGAQLDQASAQLGESAHCFRFIVITSIPLAIALFSMLRRAHPMALVPVVLAGLLATAAIAAALLQFYHPFDVTWIDFGMHFAAIGAIVAIGCIGRNWLLSS